MTGTALSARALRRFTRLAAIGLAVVILGCGGGSSGLPTASVKIGSENFTLEIAADQPSQEMGLMRRKAMDPEHGMLFVFPDEKPLNFWMADTYIPLDIIFLNKSANVVSVHQMAAYDRATTSSDYPAQYAIELNRGKAEEAGVHIGDHLEIPAAAKVAAH